MKSFLEENEYSEQHMITILVASHKPHFFIGDFSLHPVTVIFTLKSTLSADTEPLEAEGQIADRYVSCENTVIHLKEFQLHELDGGYYEVYRALRGYLLKELLKQM